MSQNRQIEMIIDISNSRREKDLIKSIIDQLGFPDLYGHDWKGLGEHFFYDPMMKMPKQLTIKGMKLLETETPNLFNQLKGYLEEYKENNKDFELIIE